MNANSELSHNALMSILYIRPSTDYTYNEPFKVKRRET